MLNINKRVTNRNIDQSLSKFDVERGSQKGVVHCHGLVQITHHSNIQLAYKKFREWVLPESVKEAAFQYIKKFTQTGEGCSQKRV